jgi:MFS family permease
MMSSSAAVPNDPEACGDVESPTTDTVFDTLAVEEDKAPREEPPVPPWYILPLIVFSQFAGTSLWFAGNAVLPDLADELDLPESSLSFLTSSVQLGFIVGSLVSALTHLADRHVPTRLFCASALTGALLNALIIVPMGRSLTTLVLLRFGTGCTLAGIYPVGMKVAADWYSAGLGQALGYLVGALVLGTAVPFLLARLPQDWTLLLGETSALAATGGLLLLLAKPPSHATHPSATTTVVAATKVSLDLHTIRQLFVQDQFRAAAVSYWMHMWELYAFWTWLPVVWEDLLLQQQEAVSWNADTVTFGIIAVGAVGCIGGGHATRYVGSAAVATASLVVSGVCCLLSPLAFVVHPVVALALYLVWGVAVVADSPQFSSLVAHHAPPAYKGTALTVVNCVGFALTIGSIQWLGAPWWSSQYLYLWLAPGPIYGVWTMRQGFFVAEPGEMVVGTKGEVEEGKNLK